MQGTLETRYWLSFFPLLLAPLMAEPLCCSGYWWGQRLKGYLLVLSVKRPKSY
jgi:hypothetical protein